GITAAPKLPPRAKWSGAATARRKAIAAGSGQADSPQSQTRPEALGAARQFPDDRHRWVPRARAIQAQARCDRRRSMRVEASQSHSGWVPGRARRLYGRAVVRPGKTMRESEGEAQGAKYARPAGASRSFLQPDNLQFARAPVALR